MILYILVDTSGSMEGAKIGALNDLMDNIISELNDIDSSLRSEMKIAVLQFARSVRWMHDEPCLLSNFKWEYLEANGMTSFGKACIELSEHIDRDCSHEDFCTIVISDGCPTDDYEEGLEFLNGNMRFFKSKRYAIALDGADIPSLARFTDDCNNILPLSSLGELFNTILLTIKQTSREDYNTKKVVSDDDDEWS